MKTILCFTIFIIHGHCQKLPRLPNYSTDVNAIERPCGVSNIDCIRRYFAKNGKCKMAFGPVPDPLYFKQTNAYLSAVNLTITTDNVFRSGLNGRIEKFYINKATDKLVLSVEFSNLRIFSNDSYVTYHRRGKEPIINKAYIDVFIRSITMTIIIPNIRDLQLEFGETYVFFNSPDYTVELGPNAFRGSDPGLRRASIELITQSDNVFKEGMMTDGPSNIIGFIQHNICDFGL